MREYFLFSSPQLKPAFVKANQPFDGGRKPSNSGGDEEVQGQAARNKERGKKIELILVLLKMY